MGNLIKSPIVKINTMNNVIIIKKVEGVLERNNISYELKGENIVIYRYKYANNF